MISGLAVGLMPSDMGKMQLFFEGDRFYDALLSDLMRAEHSVLMEFYIFNFDQTGTRLLSVLRDLALHRDVQVRLMLDGIGSRAALPSIERELDATGVELVVYKPLTFFSLFRSGLHRRNHRKIVLIDRKICYMGGMNIKDENSHRLYGPTRWRDTMMRIEKSDENSKFFRFLFAGMVLLFKAVKYGVYPISIQTLMKKGHRAVRSFVSLRQKLQQWHRQYPLTEPRLYSTLFRRDRARYRNHYRQLLRAARNRIFLSSPYFVLNHRLVRLLRAKARRGVDVRILTAGMTDVWSARQAGRSTYASLLGAGVRIFEMEGRVFHAKQSLIDDTSFIGSGNLDYRSFLHNQEVMVQCGDFGVARELLLQWGKDINESKEVHLAEWRRRGFLQKISEKLCYGFRYYL